MKKTSQIYTMFACLLAMLCVFSVAKAQQTPEEQAQQILDATGVKGGLIVHFGCGDGQLTVALHGSNSYYVHGLDTSEANVATARAYVKSQGLYGDKVMVEQFTGNRLPYIENLVNLLVSEQPLPFDANEILRVLAPNGVAYIKDGESWTMTVKPRPAEIDEWTHYLHDASNNAVAHDSVVGPPARLQWVGSPKWSRQHDHMTSISGYVSANGRNFYIIDEGSKVSIQLPSKWFLYARDAFNGTILWKKPISSWMTQMWPFKSGPALLPRRLVAAGDRVYVTLGMDGTALSELDAATGETIQTYLDTEMTEEIIYSDGVLFLVVKDDPNITGWNAYRIKYRKTGDNKAYVASEYPWDEQERIIAALDANDGSTIWDVNYPIAPMTLAADANCIYFHDGNSIVCLDRTNGGHKWTSDVITRQDPMPPKFGPTLVVYDDVVLFEGGDSDRILTALSAETGDILWTDNHAKTGHNCPYDLLVVDDKAWVGAIAGKTDSGTFTGWDPHTGQKSSFPLDVEASWMHHRCHRAKATDKYLLTSRMGIEFIDPVTEQWTIHHWTRSGCMYGLVPCNGFVYTTPHDCACYLQSKTFGFLALAPAHSDPNYPQAPPDEERLEQGPAYGEPLADPPGAEDWPTYRCDPNRSGYTKSVVPAEIESEWETQLEGELTAPVIANGRLYLAAKDLHTIYALNEPNGKLLWSYMAGGRVDSPPSIYKGRVIFGCADGWVYCLRASDGALIWRFQAAPEQLKMTSFEQVESVWPLSGSVLIMNDTVHCIAGRMIFLDGGLRFLRIDPVNGNLISENILDDRDPNTGENVQTKMEIPGKRMAVALPDILSSDGKRIYMRAQRFDLQGIRLGIDRIDVTDQVGEGAHLFSPTGFVDDSWFHRAYFIFGKDTGTGYTSAGKNAPAGRILTFADSYIYGYGRQPQYFKWTTPLEYHLFCAEKYPESESIEYHWTDTSVPLLARAMVLADKILWIAGPEDVVDEESAFDWWSMDPCDPNYDPNIPAKLDEQDALLEGQNGALLRPVSTLDGNSIAEYNLESPPVWDGMAGANGKLYIVMNNSKVKCFIGTNYPPIVDIGEDRVIYPMAPVVLDANVTDDGFPKIDPCDPCSAPIGVTTSWSKFDGPGEVTFDDPCAIDTTASFSQWGAYTLVLTAFDGGASYYDDIDIYVCRPGDLDCDNDVDILDVGKFVTQWLFDECNPLNDWCSGADQLAGGNVYFGGYAVVASNWLLGVHPAAPTNLAAEPLNNQISLDWDDNTEADIAGYNVYRSLSHSSGYTKINESLLTNSQYLDTSVSNCITYYYVVTAEDTFGYESAYSDEVSASPGVQPVMKLIASIGVTTSGSNVTRWNDQANNNDGVADADANRPELIDPAINGEPAIEFDGTGEHLDVADSTDINKSGPFYAKTLVVVFKTSSDITSRQVIWEQGGGNKGGLNFYIDSSELYINGWQLKSDDDPNWGQTLLTTPTPLTENTVYVATMVMDSGSGSFEGFVNGASIGVYPGTAYYLPTHGGDCAFGHNEWTSKFHSGGNKSVADFNGQIAEFYEFNAVLSTTDRQTLEDALMSKYGIGGG